MTTKANLFENLEKDRISILAHYNRTPESIKTDVKLIEEWLARQPHLPQVDLGDKRIEKFLLLSKMSLEKTKEKIDLYFTVRKKWPELFVVPNKPSMKIARNQYFCYPLPTLTNDLSRVYIYQIKETDAEKIIITDYIAHWINVTDLTLDTEINLKAIAILDLKFISFQLFKLASITIIKQIVFIFNKIYTGRIKEIHFINGPGWMDVILNTLKSFAPPKMVKRIYVHEKLENLSKFVPIEFLPKDYGGLEKSLEDIHELWSNALDQHAEWVEKLNSCHINEKLRPEKLEDDGLLGIHGNFRQLCVD